MKTVLALADISIYDTTELRKKYEVIDKSQMHERARDVEAVLTWGTIGPDSKMLAELPALKFIHVLGVGYEKVDIPAAEERGITVSNGSGANADAVADHTLGLMLAVARDIPRLDKKVRDGKWREDEAPRPQLAGHVCGILGLGSIGEKIARRAAAFDMTIAYHNRKKHDVPYAYYASARELAAASDFLIVAAPAAGHALVDRDVLSVFKGFLINISRGSNVDTQALIEALREKRLAGAALDVIDGEPEVPRELLAFSNVVLTPHVAGVSPESLRAMIDRALNNLDAFFKGGEVVSQLTHG